MPRSEMTPGQFRWLLKLRNEGPQKRPRYGAFPCAECVRKGWTEGWWIDRETGERLSAEDVVARKFKGIHIEEDITEHGRAVLDSYNPTGLTP